MAAGFAQVLRDVVVVLETGTPEFEESSKALAEAIKAARKHGRKILFDHRLVDLSNYYGFIVRHAEMAPAMGLDDTFRIAHLGAPHQDDVLGFMVEVGRNRGWMVRRFFEMEEALLWLA
jgi:hypothetical protein